MNKKKFVFEYEIKASADLLYAYLSEEGLLRNWFADKVSVNREGIFNFVWEGVDHKAKITGRKVPSYLKYQFISSPPDSDPAYIEFFLERNEITQSSFLKVVDYTEENSENDEHEVWNNIIDTLKDKVGAI